MKASPRYLIAKYVPDVRRMEPVNVGVIVWSAGQTASRFLPADEAIAFVNDRKTYQRWLEYWQELLGQDTIRVAGGETVSRTNPLFVDEFLKTQKGNYLLADSGVIVDKVPARKVASATDYLFDQLVARKGVPSTPREERVMLRAICARLFSEAGLVLRKDFKRAYSVACRVGQAKRDFRFDYAVANGRLNAAYQRVALPQPQSVNHTAFMFEHAQREQLVDKTRCAAIVQVDEVQADTAEVRDSIALLSEFATVVNVSDYQAAVEQVSELAGEEHA